MPRCLPKKSLSKHSAHPGYSASERAATGSITKLASHGWPCITPATLYCMHVVNSACAC